MEKISKIELAKNKKEKRQNIEEIVREQKNFFATGKTKEISYRKESLKKIKKAIIEY